MTPYDIAQYAKGVYPPINSDLFQSTYLNASVTAAVCIKDRSVIVAFAGTHDFQDILDDAFVIPCEIPEVGWVHAGFYAGMGDAANRILNDLEHNVGFPLPSLIVTGHSLGAAHATIFTAICGSNGITVDHLVLLESPPTHGQVWASLSHRKYFLLLQ